MSFFSKLKSIINDGYTNEEVDQILNIFHELFNNYQVKKIVENFIKNYPIADLECFAAFAKKKFMKYLPLFTPENIEKQENKLKCVKHTLLAAYNEWKKVYRIHQDLFNAYQCVKYNEDFTVEAYSELHLKEEKKRIIDNYERLTYLYNSLVEQHLLNDNKFEKQAFYLLVSECYNIFLKNMYQDYIQIYNLQGKGNQEIAQMLIDLDIDREKIKFILRLKYFYEENDRAFTSSYIKDIDNEAIEIIDKTEKNKKSKSFIEKLSKGDIHDTALSIYDVDLMSGTEFENFIANLFEKMGYMTIVTKSSGDQGVDVVATKVDSIVAIQTKCYSGVVGNHAIMEAVAGMKYYKANKCMVITNSTFTTSAIQLAEANNVELWDRSVLKEKIEEVYSTPNRTNNIIRAENNEELQKNIVRDLHSNKQLIVRSFIPLVLYLKNDYSEEQIESMILEAYSDYKKHNISIINYSNYLKNKYKEMFDKANLADYIEDVDNLHNQVVQGAELFSDFCLIKECHWGFDATKDNFYDMIEKSRDVFPEMQEVFYTVTFVKYFTYLPDVNELTKNPEFIKILNSYGKDAEVVANKTYDEYLRRLNYNKKDVRIETYEHFLNFMINCFSNSPIYMADSDDDDVIQKPEKEMIPIIKSERFKDFDNEKLFRTFLYWKIDNTLTLDGYIKQILNVEKTVKKYAKDLI